MSQHPIMNISDHRTSALRTRAAVAFGAVIVGVALIASACGGGSPAATTTTGAGGAPPTSAAPSRAGATISIKNFAFSPSTLTVAPGAKVTVTNHDSVTHTVTSSSGKFDTGPVGPGHSVTITAPGAAGKYPYICSIHQFMTGTLDVS
jgi:plastocyanin